MIYSKVTLLILILVLIVQYRKYGSRVLLHPSLYFLAVWIISVISFEIFLLAGFKRLIIDVNTLNELFVYVSFTALCFLVVGYRKHRYIKDSVIDMELFIKPAFFKILTVAFFIISFAGLFFFSGFDVAENRAAETTATIEFYGSGSKYSVIQLILNVTNMLLIPFTLYGGWSTGGAYFSGKRVRLIYLLPLIANIMAVIAGGGRAGIISTSVFFIIGLLFSLFTFPDNYWARSKGLIKYGIIVVLLFSIYASFVSTERSKYKSGQNTYFEVLEQYPSLKPFYGILEYTVFHYQGYQWRRHDSTTPELEFGRETFSFILDFNIPVISQVVGKDLSLKTAFNLKDIDPVRAGIERMKKNMPGASITATVYYVLYDDFGYFGVFVITFLFVWLTEKLYRNLFIKRHYTFWSIIIFIAVYKLWTSTIFSHHLSGAWFNGYFYPILIIEFINYFYYRRNNRIIAYETA